MDYTLLLGNSVIYLNKVLGISKTLERCHADYREGKITERELNQLQAPLLQKVSISRSIECLTKGTVLKNLDNGLRRLRAAGSDVQMLSMNPLQAFFKASFGIGLMLRSTQHKVTNSNSQVFFRKTRLNYWKDTVARKIST